MQILIERIDENFKKAENLVGFDCFREELISSCYLEYKRTGDLADCLNIFKDKAPLLMCELYSKNLRDSRVRLALESSNIVFLEQLKSFLINNENYEDVVFVNELIKKASN